MTAIDEAVKAEKLEGYAFPVNSQWTAVVLKNDIMEGEQMSQQLSQRLAAYVFYFCNAEDHGWGYTLFSQGQKAADLYIDYETQEELGAYQETNLPLLEQICLNQESLTQLAEYFTQYQEKPELLFEGVRYFKEAFGLHKIEWISYEYLKGKIIKQLEAIPVGIKSKSPNVKSIVKKTIEKQLNELGYFYDKAESRSSYFYYLKEVNGFKMGLSIEKERYLYNNYGQFANKIDARLCHPVKQEKTLYYLYHRNDEKKLKEYEKEYTYSNEEELKKIMAEIMKQFKTVGIPWLEEVTYEAFEPLEIYTDLVDHFLAGYGYQRTSTSENILVGGKVVYENVEKNSRLIFSHFTHLRRLNLYLYYNDKYISCDDIAYEKSINTYEVYISSEDYITSIKNYLEVLSKYILNEDIDVLFTKYKDHILSEDIVKYFV